MFVSMDVGLYLINQGCGSKEDKGLLLCGACQYNRLDVIKELVEKHNISISGELLG